LEEKGDPAGRGSGSSRKGTSAKTVLTDDGEIEIAVPRDRAGSFETLLTAKGQTRFDGFDEKISPPLRPRNDGSRDPGPSSPTLWHRGLAGSQQRVTDAALDEVREWQIRPLGPV
jgi:transposase-like protein